MKNKKLLLFFVVAVSSLLVLIPLNALLSKINAQDVTFEITGKGHPEENIPLTITIKNDSSNFISDINVKILSINGKTDLQPFTLWGIKEAQVSTEAPLLSKKTVTLTIPLASSADVTKETYEVTAKIHYKNAEGKDVDFEQKGFIMIGELNFLAKGIRWLINFFFNFLKNYGLAIIAVTILIKLIFQPLTHYQFKATAMMQKVQPFVEEVKQKYKGDAKKINEETMKLYKEHNVNLFGGCLPLLVQWPVFFAMFSSLNNFSPFNNANFLWLTSLTLPDKWYILPVLVALTTYLQSVSSFMPGQDKGQSAFLLYFMPLLLGFWALKFTSALSIYWVTFSVFSTVQQYFIIRKLHKDLGLAAHTQTKPSKKAKK